MKPIPIKAGLFDQIPSEKGTYVLVLKMCGPKKVKVGRLGEFALAAGYYYYVGSAFGPGGLRARLHHHLRTGSAPHWHIDYLLRVAPVEEIWLSTKETKLERTWAETLERSVRFKVPVWNFGCSDCGESRASHLFYVERRPVDGVLASILTGDVADVGLKRLRIQGGRLSACDSF